MARLTVKDFSCIKKADLEVANFTIIMGEQASGKSLLAKLIHFLQTSIEQVETIPFATSREVKIDSYKEQIISEFSRWFPENAWGKGRFEIRFEINDFYIVIKRPSVAQGSIKKIKIEFSELFEKEFALLSERINKINTNEKEDIVKLYPVINREIQQFKKNVGIISFNSVFIPAGRSYFTSVGGLVSVFKQARSLEPIMLQFGDFYTFLMDNTADDSGQMFRLHLKPNKTLEKNILGGEVVNSKDARHILYDDGRAVPFAFASSGQQELIPLLQALYYYDRADKNSRIRNNTQLIIIEEPEAHLFPSAQSEIMSYIASFVTGDKASIFVTTHSPYILSQVNNFIKAGIIASKSNEITKNTIEKIISKSVWLKKGDVIAYTIRNGILENGMDDETGLINADLIDEASTIISEKFSELLDIEFSDV